MDLSTANNYVQLGLWAIGGFTYAKEMLKQNKLEAPFKRLHNRVAGYALVAGLIISSASLYYSLNPRVVVKTVGTPAAQSLGVLKGWGDPAGKSCVAEVDPLEVLKYESQFEISAICGFNDATVDKFSDERITVSPLYTISASDDLKISVPFAKPMTNIMEKTKSEVVKKVGACSQVAFESWVEIVLLPKGTNPADIRRLEDVQRYNGKMLSQPGSI